MTNDFGPPSAAMRKIAERFTEPDADLPPLVVIGEFAFMDGLWSEMPPRGPNDPPNRKLVYLPPPPTPPSISSESAPINTEGTP